MSEKAPVSGTVAKITPTEIVIKDNKGKKHSVDIYDNYPLARKTQISSQARVKVGDKVMYDKYAGTTIKVDGDEKLLVRMADILAVVS